MNERERARGRVCRIAAGAVVTGALALGTLTPAHATPQVAAAVSTAQVAPTKNNTVVVRKGDRGALVRKVQFALKRKGYHVAVNGKFGPQTHSAIRRFQKRNRLPITGKVDRRTWRVLGLGRPPGQPPAGTTTTTTVSVPDTVYRHPRASVERWHDVALEVGWPESKWKRLSCLINRESHGNERAYNRSGAMGLLQIMYRAHKSRVGPDSSVLFDGRTNLKVGLIIYRASGWGPWGNACSTA